MSPQSLRTRRQRLGCRLSPEDGQRQCLGKRSGPWKDIFDLDAFADYFDMFLRGGEKSTLVGAIGLPEGSRRLTRGPAVPRPSVSLSVSSYLILKT